MRKPNHHRKLQQDREPAKGGFDCIAFKRRAQARIRRKIKGMTPAEELAYWNRPPDGQLGEWWRSIQAHSAEVRERPENSGT